MPFLVYLMSRNNQSNRIIKWLVMAGDFIVLNVVMLAFAQWHWRMGTWDTGGKETPFLLNLIISLPFAAGAPEGVCN